MNKNVVTFFISFILSLEFVVVICALLIATFGNVSDQWVENNIALKGDALKYLAFLPLGLGGYVFSESRKLLFPNSNANRVLHEWDGYPELKITVYVAITYGFIFIILGLASWLFIPEIKTFIELLVILTSIVGSVVLAASVYVARINLDEITEKIK